MPDPVPLLFRTLQGAWDVQDDLKLRRRLTANIGLRHELTNGWKEENDAPGERPARRIVDRGIKAPARGARPVPQVEIAIALHQLAEMCLAPRRWRCGARLRA